MKTFGGFDLRKYSDVVSHAESILSKIESGEMPCDGAWTAAQVEILRKWVQSEKLP